MYVEHLLPVERFRSRSQIRARDQQKQFQYSDSSQPHACALPKVCKRSLEANYCPVICVQVTVSTFSTFVCLQSNEEICVWWTDLYFIVRQSIRLSKTIIFHGKHMFEWYCGLQPSRFNWSFLLKLTRNLFVEPKNVQHFEPLLNLEPPACPLSIGLN